MKTMSGFLVILAAIAAILFATAALAESPEPVQNGRTLSQWIERTKDKDDCVREEAVIALAQMGTRAKRALPELTRLLGDPSVDVRFQAKRALAAMEARLQEEKSGLREADARSLIISQIAEKPFVRPDVPTFVGSPKADEIFRAKPIQHRLDPLRAENSAVCEADARSLMISRTAEKPSTRADLSSPAWSPELDEIFRAKPIRNRPDPPRERHTLSQWIERTKDKDERVREAAATALAQMGRGAKRALPELTRLLGDPSVDVRLGAKRAFAAIGPEAASQVPALVKMLDDPQWYVREAAAEALGSIGPDAKAAAPGLAKLLKCEDIVDRWAALGALDKIGPDADDAPALAAVLYDCEPEIHDRAVALLTRLGDKAKTAVPVLIQQLAPGVPHYVQRNALAVLGKIGSVAKDAVPTMAEALKDRYTRSAAFTALIEMGPVARPALPQLIAVMRRYADGDYDLADDPDWTPRWTDAEMVDLIVKWTRDPSSSVRKNGAALWNMLDSQDISRVALLLQSGNACEHELAMAKLVDLGEPAGPLLAKTLEEGNEDLRLTLLRMLERRDAATTTVTPVLLKLLHDHNPKLRIAAAIALGKVGGGSTPVVEGLAAALADADVNVRVCAIEALGRIGPAAASAIAALAKRLDDDSPVVRSAAARALGQIGPAAKAAVPALEKRREDQVDYVRETAADVLRQIQAKGGKDRR